MILAVFGSKSTRGFGMLSIRGQGGRLCDGLDRREILRIGGLGAFGLALPQLLQAREPASQKLRIGKGKARSCIILFLMGGPPQHSTWDPKPDAPAQIRGQYRPIATAVPGVQVSELLSRTSRVTDRICILRGVCTNDNAHSSSGYYMLTGQPHQPMNAENANPGAPNNWPSLAALVGKFHGGRGPLPPAIRLPHHIFNTDGSVWPGQDAGFLGHTADPWLFNVLPNAADMHVSQFSLSAENPTSRLENRHSLLEQLDQHWRSVDRIQGYDKLTERAFGLLRSEQARAAFHLDHEPEKVRERYGRSHFGQSVLMARRLIEAGVGLVQVNWYRGADEPPDTPCWDSHTRESERLKKNLTPPFDTAYSALIEDLHIRGLLEETLVVCMAEFGRSPKMNPSGGRDHWGHVFSVALGGGGIKGGMVHGASDRIGGYPKDGMVGPPDLAATIFHCLGLSPETQMIDALGRPLPISRGEVIRQII
jgi:hypothetical protein